MGKFVPRFMFYNYTFIQCYTYVGLLTKKIKRKKILRKIRSFGEMNGSH